MNIDLSKYQNRHSLFSMGRRVLWGLVWALLFRPSPRILRGWRRFLLRLFGARVGREAYLCPSVRIWAPWNLEIGNFSWIGDHVDCYCVAPIRLGSHVVVSQYSYLCTASHNHSDPHFALVTSPISIGSSAWVAADVFVGPGVTVGAGAVLGARSTVLRDVEAWTIVAGNPARFLKKRVLTNHA